MKHWYTNGIIEIKVNEGTEPEGFNRGRLPMTDSWVEAHVKAHLGKPSGAKGKHWKLSDEAKRNHSISLKCNPNVKGWQKHDNMSGKKHLDETKDKISKALKEYCSNPDVKKSRSERMVGNTLGIDQNKNKTPEEISAIAAKRRKHYIYDNISFDSLPELNFYKYCKRVGYDIKRGPTLAFYVDGKKHHYNVDFIVNGALIEIKGDHLINEDGSWRIPYKNATEKQQEIAKAKYECAIQNSVYIIPSSKCLIFSIY